MQRAVLTIVGILYLALGLWCTLTPQTTAAALGFTLSSAGLIEYLVVYGGLEVGLGLAMILGARRPRLLPGVLFMTTVFSGFLPFYRLVSMMYFDVSTTVVAILFLESAILVALLVSAWHGRSRATAG